MHKGHTSRQVACVETQLVRGGQEFTTCGVRHRGGTFRHEDFQGSSRELSGVNLQSQRRNWSLYE